MSTKRRTSATGRQRSSSNRKSIRGDMARSNSVKSEQNSGLDEAMESFDPFETEHVDHARNVDVSFSHTSSGWPDDLVSQYSRSTVRHSLASETEYNEDNASSNDYYYAYEYATESNPGSGSRGGGVNSSHQQGNAYHLNQQETSMPANPNHTFSNAPLGVEVRSLDLMNKIAFEKTSIVPAEYKNILLKDDRKKGLISPSLLHCEALERIHGQRFVRQLAWKSSVSYDADLSSEHKLVNVREYVASLPNMPPRMFKFRLPMRSDVGFPGATDEEVRLKQEEICTEAEHEEVQPRLLLLGSHLLSPSSSVPPSNAQQMNKKNPCSMFSPPIESISSSSKMWRSRPFQDRPTGMTYLVASPIDVSFATPGGSEPLVATLSLYCLAKATKVQKENDISMFRGKISEDCVFPVGNWRGLLKEEAGQFIKESLFGTASLGRDFGDDEVRFSEKRKKKAMFSFDPLVVPESERSLYVVLQIFKVAQSNALNAFGAGEKKKSMFGSNKKMTAKSSTSAAKRIFSIFGSQFLTPLCFGLAPVIAGGKSVHDKNLKWPNGATQSIALFSFPKHSESQEDFVERLAILSGNGAISPPIAQSKKLDGKALIFTSVLGSDFCQVLQQTSRASPNSSPDSCPRLLVDASGDAAIMMSPENDTSSLGSKSRRSDLVRLPASPRPGGYIDSFEVKEVVYFPPRLPDQHESDIPLSAASFLNVMYLYPKQLILKRGGDRGEREKFYSVRIRLIRQVVVSDEGGSSETVRSTVDAIYNPAPGKPVLQAAYTKIPHAQSKQGENVVHFRDEFKIRLPPILDGSHYLQFSLFNIELSENMEDGNAGINAESLAEGLLPITKKSEPSYKYQVATLIPNGIHDISLGNFQLQIATRAASSIHVTDPSIATMFCHSSDVTKSLRPGQHRNDPFNLSHSEILEKASDHAIVDNFRVLVFVHLFHLAKEPIPNSDNMNALFEILRKTKAVFRKNIGKLNVFFKDFVDSFDEIAFFLQPKDMSIGSSKGSVIDTLSFFNFDHLDDASAVGSHTPNSRQSVSKVDRLSDAAIATVEEMLLDAAIYVIAYQQTRSDGMTGMNLPRTNSAISRRDPFSRKAFGASKTEQMKAEAEIEDETRLADYFDDDNSVGSTYTSIVKESMRNDGYANHGENNSVIFGDNDHTVYTVGSDARSFSGAGNGDRSTVSSPQKRTPLNTIRERIKQNSLARRVTTLAQVAVAPCVVPDFTAAITRKKKTPNYEIMHVQDDHSDEEQMHYSAGSDIEDEDDHLIDTKKAPFVGKGLVGLFPCAPRFLGYPEAPKIRGRVRLVDSMMPFSRNVDEKEHGSLPSVGHSYVYESILVLWIRAWRQTTEPSKYERSNTVAASLPSFFSNIGFLLPLCLKSLTLRMAHPDSMGDSPDKSTKELTIPSTLDDGHMRVLMLFMDVLAFGAMRNTMENYQIVLNSALGTSFPICDQSIDFLIGLLAIVHPSQISLLIERYITTLFIAEHDDLEVVDPDMSSGWRRLLKNFGKDTPQRVSAESSSGRIIRANCSRRLRLRAVEKLSMIPGFVAINYPLAYPSTGRRRNLIPASWTHQNLDDYDEYMSCPYSDGFDRLPRSHWLAEILVSNTLSICASSLEISSQQKNGGETEAQDSSKSHDSSSRIKDNLKHCEDIAFKAIGILYDFLFRRHATDMRFPTEAARTRITGMFTVPFLEMTIKDIISLMRVDPSNRVRCLWLLCFLHICQESPEQLIRDQLRIYCNSKGNTFLSKFIRLIKMCILSFQGFIGESSSKNFTRVFNGTTRYVQDITWLVQESFNTICAVIILLIDECADILLAFPDERKKSAQGVFDCILFVLTTPQSSVTQTRGLGAVSLGIEKFGVSTFLETVSDNFQHWARVLLSLMNSPELSVRSVAVDLTVSIIGGVFDEVGSIDEISLVFLTVMPEVVAREIGLYCLRGQINNFRDAEVCLWPLRRALGDLEETNPDDDDRVDVQLSPILVTFCQACQAIIDGVIIELRLEGDNCIIAGKRFNTKRQPDNAEGNNHVWQGHAFDADEESLYEAASIFQPETAPMQRLRWLLALKALHESKGQWLEAAETYLLCARTIAESIPHIASIWRPSLFSLWRDSRRSPWLAALTDDTKSSTKQNVKELILFADRFLESPTLLMTGTLKIQASDPISTFHGKLYYPTVPSLCAMLSSVCRDAVNLYAAEGGTEVLAFSRLEHLLKNVMGVVDTHRSAGVDMLNDTTSLRERRKRFAEEHAALRQTSNSINSLLAKLAESMVYLEKHHINADSLIRGKHIFVRLTLLGKKPRRFEESTSIPTFLEWGSPFICRVRNSCLATAQASNNQKVRKGRNSIASQGSLEDRICEAFAAQILEALCDELSFQSVILCTKSPSEGRLSREGDTKTFLVVTLVQMSNAFSNNGGSNDIIESKRFYSKNLLSNQASQDAENDRDVNGPMTIIESTVAQHFPCALSRQRAIITTEFVPGGNS